MKADFIYRKAIEFIYPETMNFERVGSKGNTFILPKARKQLENFPQVYGNVKNFSASSPSRIVRLHLKPINPTHSKLTVYDEEDRVIKEDFVRSWEAEELSFLLVKVHASNGSRSEFIIPYGT